jgi:hypothetical protein
MLRGMLLDILVAVIAAACAVLALLEEGVEQMKLGGSIFRHIVCCLRRCVLHEGGGGRGFNA